MYNVKICNTLTTNKRCYTYTKLATVEARVENYDLYGYSIIIDSFAT